VTKNGSRQPVNDDHIITTRGDITLASDFSSSDDDDDYILSSSSDDDDVIDESRAPEPAMAAGRPDRTDSFVKLASSVERSLAAAGDDDEAYEKLNAVTEWLSANEGSINVQKFEKTMELFEKALTRADLADEGSAAMMELENVRAAATTTA
jgi:hypothetical protein